MPVFNPWECISTCDRLRAQGVAPPECTYCETPCNVDIIDSIEDALVALAHDTYEAVVLVTKCIERGVVGCICAGALMLRPDWLSPDDFRFSPEQKCYTGNVIWQLSSKLMEVLEQPMMGIFGDVFGAINNGNNPLADSAFASKAERQARAECATPNRFGHQAADLCYYERVTRRDSNPVTLCTCSFVWRFIQYNGTCRRWTATLALFPFLERNSTNA